MVSRVYIFKGLVQNVGFRSFIRHVAVENSITGWVQNNPDGTVSALFEGEKSSIESAIDKILLGNGIIKVSDYIISDEKYLQQRNFKTFFIKF